MFVRLCKTTSDKGTLIPENEDISKYIGSEDVDYYLSTFKYNDKHYAVWKEKGTVSGITDVVTDRIYFDFDDATDNSKAHTDAIRLVNKLVKIPIPEENIQIYFSGGKGFGVEFKTSNTFSPDEVKNITENLAKDLKTFDKQIYNASRILRIPNTKHNKTKLYKIPLSKNQLETLTVDEIKALAKKPSKATPFKNEPIELPEDVIELRGKETNPFDGAMDIKPIMDLDTMDCPRWLDKAKFALQQGYFGYSEGDSNKAFLILASTYKNQGFDRNMVLNMLKAVAERQGKIRNEAPWSEKRLVLEIVNYVFSPNHKGGQWPLDDELLMRTRSMFNIPWTENKPKIITDINPKFVDYVKNIDKNRIKTELPDGIDDSLYLSVGSNVGILGAPGSGKSALALQILSNTSKSGIKSVFASLDMTSTRIYEKIMYRVSGGMSRDELYRKFKTGQAADLVKKVQDEFSNVYFFDKSSPSVKDIRDYVNQCNQHNDEKVKLVVIDYFERLSSDVSDDTAASKKVAGELQDLVNDLGICLITLVQPNKMSGDMSKPILSYTNIKGSSFLAQSFRQIIAIYREGFNPTSSSNDRFLTINILKNDLGESGSFDYKWTGKTGNIDTLSWEGSQTLANLRAALANQGREEGGLE